MSGFAETSWEHTPDLLDEKCYEKLTLERCDLDYWINNVAQGALQGLVNGHHPETKIPAHMFENLPLREAMIDEFAYRTRTEEVAAQGLSNLVFCAPTSSLANFFITLILDEARHAQIFKQHIIELGVSKSKIDETIDRYVNGGTADIAPLEAWALNVVRNQMDFYGGVLITTVIIEGALAPASALSERKWRRLNPAGAEVEQSAAMDELRHLGVGASIIRNYLRTNPNEKQRLLNLIIEGSEIWHSLPSDERLLKRENLFQEGMEKCTDVLKGYEIYPGRLLLDTSPRERLDLANRWCTDMQINRLRYMGLDEAAHAWR